MPVRVERDAGKVAGSAAQQGGEPPPRIDLAGLGELHADDAQRAPCDEAGRKCREHLGGWRGVG